MLGQLETRSIAILDRIESGDASKAEVAQALAVLNEMKARVREVEGAMKAATIAYIHQNGPVEDGETVYTVGHARTVKCSDAGRTLDAVLNAAGGDLDAASRTLASNPFKHGTVRTLIGDAAWKECFREEVSERLEVKTINKQFARSKA